MKKKIILCITGLAIVAMIVPSSAQAVTAAELQEQINALMATLAELQSQLADLTGEPGGGVGVSCTFTRSLYPGMTGTDVKCLQEYLNDAGYTVAASGYGSAGNETQYYGSLTKAAVGAWQDGNGVAYGNYKGYFGPISQAKYDALAAGGVTAVCGNGVCESGETATSCPADCETVTPIASGLKISLASDTPDSASIADDAIANFTKFKLTAGSEGDVKISKIYVTRTGLSANSDVLNIKIVDAATGEYKGSIGSLNVDNRAMISIIPSLVIPAGTTKTYFIRAAIKNAATAGKTVKLGIAANSDIVSDASEVTGASVTGNAMNVVTLDIGGLTVSEIGSTIDSQPYVGDTDVIVLNWKAQAGATEPVTIETVTVKRTGTADASDTVNIELYNVTNSVSLGTVAEWSADDKATWSDLGIVIGKGETRRFKIMIDVVGGVSSTPQTVNVDMVDGSDCLVVAKGNTYGFYVAPTSAITDWGGGDAASRGKADNDQTIQAGALNVSKSSSTPATGSIAAGDDIVLGVFDLEAKGEDIRITAFGIDFTLTSGGPMTYDEITNVALVDEDGDIVAGPKDASQGIADRGGASAHGYLDFSDTFIVPVGIHSYTVKAKIADAVSGDDTIIATVDRPGTSITAVGMTSNDDITPTPAGDVSGNTLTVAGAALNVVTLAEPSGRTVAVGANDFVWATFSLDAGTSGEDINVTAITVTDTTSSATTAGHINNAALWADLTSENSDRGDVYETRITDLEQPPSSTTIQAYVFNQTITVQAGYFIKIALVADLDAGATAVTHVFTIADDVTHITSIGADTGSSFDEGITAVGQTMTVSTVGGVVTVTQDASKPDPDIIIGGEIATLNVFRLAATNVEDLDLNDMTLYVTGGDDVDTFYFYHGDTLIGQRPGGTGPRFDLADGTVTVPANGNVKITVKAKMLPVDDTGTAAGEVDNNTDVGVAINAAATVNLTGLSSGAAVASSEPSVAGVVHQLYESRPYFALNSGSPSGTIVAPSSVFLLAIFDVTAEDTEDITFEGTGDQLIVQIEASVYDSNNVAGIWYLKDESGTLLASESVADTSLVSASSVTFTFDESTFTVPAGLTEKLYVYGDLSDFEDEGTSGNNSIQVWLDDDSVDNCQFGIDGESYGSTGYAEGIIIFRGEIWGGTFNN